MKSSEKSNQDMDGVLLKKNEFFEKLRLARVERMNRLHKERETERKMNDIKLIQP